MLIGYMRVGKADGSQVADLQREALLAAGASDHHLYEDHASGWRDDRPGLDVCLKAVSKGNTLVAWKLDRVGRDLRHLVNLVHDLTTRGIGLRCWLATVPRLTPRWPTACSCPASSPRLPILWSAS